MILHILNKSPFQHPALLQHCLNSMGAQDSLILIEDGTLLLASLPSFNNLPDASRLFVLDSDAEARGVAINPAATHSVDYGGFVDLTVRHDKTISWL